MSDESREYKRKKNVKLAKKHEFFKRIKKWILKYF